MAKHLWMLLLLGFFDCSWAECDVDRGRPVTTRNVLERANLPLEGYFRALYVPLGGSQTRMENAHFKSMKPRISMFSDKPPCMPLCFGAFSFFLASATVAFSSFLASTAGDFSSAFSSGLAFFFLFFFFNFLFFLRLNFQPGWVM